MDPHVGRTEINAFRGAGLVVRKPREQVPELCDGADGGGGELADAFECHGFAEGTTVEFVVAGE